MSHDTLAYAFEETAGDFVKSVLETIPARWGRMPPLSRAVVVEAGEILRHYNLLQPYSNQKMCNRTIGLIGGTRWGSHSTDIAFAASMKESVTFASPALFGYTLANIPLAEAANQFGLVGPVYALIDPETPLDTARDEAKRLLNARHDLDLMLACEFDDYYDNAIGQQLSVTFTLIEKT